VSLNRISIIGNLGADPETRFMQDGSPVCSLRVAVNERWKDASGQQQERTEWFRVVAFKRLAEICQEYLSKGSKVYMEGSQRTRQWQDDSGQTRYSTEMVLQNMEMLGNRGEKQEQGQKPKAESYPEPDDFEDTEIPF